MSTCSLNYEQLTLKVGENLKKIRCDKGYTQSMLAALTDLNSTAISRIENGRTGISLKTIHILCQALDIPVRDLFEFEED